MAIKPAPNSSSPLPRLKQSLVRLFPKYGSFYGQNKQHSFSSYAFRKSLAMLSPEHTVLTRKSDYIAESCDNQRTLPPIPECRCRGWPGEEGELPTLPPCKTINMKTRTGQPKRGVAPHSTFVKHQRTEQAVRGLRVGVDKQGMKPS